ncbi:hypothetical protein P280DRAFT_444949 [Massarina eburnea CBS 473.64]|uniref:Zn(2)-C6 fungal-type domain-containing protein n=1 Tax=Massarina eburnea CBS 473.64 TaxID=1395130 RepID=A0A6A6SBK2_9PLEO|nr:hypothetical protein P280DRAFT_444949 [Massarina eburnea CBS 473.64]
MIGMPDLMATPRRKACVECRQQKIRCDVEQHKTPHDPCNRCKKMNLECRILPTSTRNLRQTKAEMRRELEELRWNMRQAGGSATATPGAGGDGQSSAFQSPIDMSSYHSGPRSGEVTDASQSLSPVPVGYGGGQGMTATRALDGYVVDAKRIDDCFSLFFTQYHPLLPVLDFSLSPQTPNEYYELSPFLFWTIIVTGSRQYSSDPTILDRISALIIPLAFSSMALRSTPIPVIQGLLILCTWRLPTNSMYKDMTHMLCGAAVHLATQIGLHVDGVGQDFARMPLKKDQDQKIFRARIWMHCVNVSIRTSCAEGIPPLVIADTFFDGDEKEREDTLAHLPIDVQFHHKLHIVLHKAMAAMARTNLKSVNTDLGVLRSLIGIFDSQLLTLAASSPSELDTFHLSCARIHILAFHFFAPPTHQDFESLSRLYSLCISVLQMSNTMAHQGSFALVSQSFVDRTVSLAGFIILKLVRSPLASHLDLAAGEAAYFHAAHFSRSISMQSNDLAARVESIMTSLWGSSKVFRRKERHPESLGLRLRTRLSMSLSFDMFWYWREEFGHMKNPYNGEEGNGSGSGQSNAHTRPGTPGRSFPSQALSQPPHQQIPQQTLPSSTHPQTSKFDPNPALMGHMPMPNATAMNFDTWGENTGSDYGAAPMLDQFPDYDWAASFDFANEWPQVPIQGIEGGLGGAGYNSFG